MKAATKLRLFGAAILLFNLWLIGQYNLQGLPVLLLTFGFAVGYEYMVVRPTSKRDRSSAPVSPQPIPPASKARSAPSAIKGAASAPVPESRPSSGDDEELWAFALAEFAGSERRPGLWARVFSQSGGDESAAKAAYLNARFLELQAARLAQRAEREEAERSAKLLAEQRAYAALPKGRCPNCRAVVLLSASECPQCKAVFGAQSAWKVMPTNET